MNLVSGTVRVLLLLKMACVVVSCCLPVVDPDGFVHWDPAMLCYPVGNLTLVLLHNAL